MCHSSTIKTLLSHRSIRKFTSQPIEESTLSQLIECGRMASSSNHLQYVSILRITDPNIRKKLMEYSGHQPYVLDAAEFLVFCMDFSHHQKLLHHPQLDWTEITLIGSIDTGIMAQNIFTAAESVGLGGVYIGGLRNKIESVAELLKLPPYCVPLLGLCLGYPAQNPEKKPRLPLELMYFKNTYTPLEAQSYQSYNQEIGRYYQKRTQIKTLWTEKLSKTLEKPIRPHILPFLQKQGLIKK